MSVACAQSIAHKLIMPGGQPANTRIRGSDETS